MNKRKAHGGRETKTLAETLAGQVFQRLHEDASFQLTSISELARQYGVAYNTMRKAIRVLVSQGAVESFRGRIARLSTPVQREHRPQNSCDRLYREIKQGIVDGIYQAGVPLPKQQYFVISSKVSTATVSIAFRKLAKEELIHKSGKSWIAGKPRVPPTESRGDPSHLRSVLFLTPWEPYIHTFFNNPHTSPFGHSLGNQLLEGRLHFAGEALKRVSPTSLKQETRFDEIRERIWGMKERFRGALVHAGRGVGDMSEWVGMLHSTGRPVVYFDSTGRNETWNRSQLGVGQRYYRVHLDESAAIRIALQQLDKMGHRIVAVPYQVPTEDWAAWRMRRVREIAASCFPKLELIFVELREKIWSLSREIRITEYRRRIREYLRTVANSVPAQNRAHILSSAPSLNSILKSEATGLLALNDALAQRYYHVLTEAGVAFPGELSIISFGNPPGSLAYPISVIDFGFARLGYLAAHIFLDDIPIRSDKEGSIPGICSYVDRGSVGPPGRKRKPKAIQ